MKIFESRSKTEQEKVVLEKKRRAADHIESVDLAKKIRRIDEQLEKLLK